MKDQVSIQREEVEFGSRKIEFSIERSERTTLGISVNPDLSVSVVAPYDASIVLIREKVLKRADWIIRQQLDFAEIEKPIVQYRYTSGESHWYLGKQYRLKFKASEVQQVSRQERYLLIEGANEPSNVKRLLRNWYKQQAADKISLLIDKWWLRLGGTNTLPKFSIRKLEKRWGSCTAQGHLLFNEDLIKAPSHCIEYVVVHELCHIFEHNHGPKFVSLLTQHIPDWEERKRKLEGLEF